MYIMFIVAHGPGESGGSVLKSDIEPSRKAGMRRGVLMTILQQNAAQLPMFMGKSSERYWHKQISLASADALKITKLMFFVLSVPPCVGLPPRVQVTCRNRETM